MFRGKKAVEKIYVSVERAVAVYKRKINITATDAYTICT
jgi:hypothetical protein